MAWNLFCWEKCVILHAEKTNRIKNITIMKKVFAVLAIAATIAACNNSASTTEAKVDSTAAAAVDTAAAVVDTAAAKIDSTVKAAVDTMKK